MLKFFKHITIFHPDLCQCCLWMPPYCAKYVRLNRRKAQTLLSSRALAKNEMTVTFKGKVTKPLYSEVRTQLQCLLVNKY